MCAAAANTGSHFAGSSNWANDKATGTSPSIGDTGVGFVVEIPDAPSRKAASPAATPSSTPAPSSGSPSGDTGVFMAIAAGMVSPAASDGAAASGQTGAPSHAAQQPRDPSVPVNPLVAARAASAASGSAGDGLFPIQDLEANGRSLDVSFAEKGHKHTALIVVIVLLVLALAAAGAFFGLRWKGAQDARAQISEAVALVQGTDDVINQLDRAIASEMNNGVADDALSDAMMQSSTTSTNLTSAETLANEAKKASSLLGDADIAAADAVLSDVSGRRSLITIGSTLQSTTKGQGSAATYLAEAYTYINAAVDKLQWSSDTFNGYYDALYNGGDTTVYDLWGAVDLDAQALTDIANAQSLVQQASAALPSLDLTALDTYLAARTEQINILYQQDTFRALGDTDSANALADSYNAATEANGAAWANVPASAEDLLGDVLYAELVNQHDAYVAARAQVIAADSVLNDYLGIVDATKRLGISSTLVIADAPVQQVAEESVADEWTDAGEGEWTEGKWTESEWTEGETVWE